jgi:CubicO group peptidase (beta-lactamase class C family)
MALASAAPAPARARVAAAWPPPDAEIHRILAERVTAMGGGFGIAVGVVGPQRRSVVTFGSRAGGDPRPIDGDTLFEIGSVTKGLTGLLIADMVRRGELAIDDPLARHLPEGLKLPERAGRSITLLDLATHTSGLPGAPTDFPPLHDAAAASYSPAQLYRFLSTYALTRDIGISREYSNLGYSLLGFAAAHRAGTDYESLLRTRVLGPLDMRSTALTLSPALKERLATGHDASMRAAPPTTLPIFAPAGGLYSTVNDLSRFLAAATGADASPLAPSLAAMLRLGRPAPGIGRTQVLGWMIVADGDDQLVEIDGGTFGFASSVVWDPKMRTGVVVLSNCVASVGDIARHLLRPEIRLTTPAPETAASRRSVRAHPAR